MHQVDELSQCNVNGADFPTLAHNICTCCYNGVFLRFVGPVSRHHIYALLVGYEPRDGMFNLFSFY